MVVNTQFHKFTQGRCNLFYDCSNFGGLGEVFAHGGEFSLAFLMLVG